MVKFSESEQKVINFLSANQEVPVTLDDIASIIYQGRERPFHWRNAISVLMRVLIDKASINGNMQIIRVSPRGSGYKAKYVAKEVM